MYGALLAVQKINDEGGLLGREVKLLIENDQSDPRVALKADQQLHEQGCQIIVGHMISGLASTVIPFINEEKILMISPTMASDDLSGIDDYFIRLIPSNVTQADLLSRAIIDQNVANIGILYSSNNVLFADTFIDNISSNLSNMETKLVGKFMFIPSMKPDYQDLLKQFIALNIDGLLIIASGDEVAKLAQFFSLSSYKPKVFLPAWSMTPDLITKGGKAVDGFYGINYIRDDSTQADYLQFKSSYLETFGILPSFSAIMTYEAVMMVASAITSSRTTDPSILKTTIISNENYHGLFGDVDIDQFGDAERNIGLYQILDGRFRRVNP